jgi:hypothetical protein
MRWECETIVYIPSSDVMCNLYSSGTKSRTMLLLGTRMFFGNTVSPSLHETFRKLRVFLTMNSAKIEIFTFRRPCQLLLVFLY